MNALVTGGAGFIGRWVVEFLLADGHDVWVVDNFSNGRRENLARWESHPRLKVIAADINDAALLGRLFARPGFDRCFHLAANVNVQNSIDDPKGTFLGDLSGTATLLDAARPTCTKIIFVSSCMVFDGAPPGGLCETSPLRPRSPYAAGKVAAEYLVQSYYYAYGMPVTVLRPFNTYGPFQKVTAEGGVVAIFIQGLLNRQPVRIYGDGRQTRDFLYVEDCARFIIAAGYSDRSNGEVIVAGTGQDVTINDLAHRILKDPSRIQHVPHIHPQAEIYKLLSNPKKAGELLGWKPTVFLEEGIRRTAEWIKQNMPACQTQGDDLCVF